MAVVVEGDVSVEGDEFEGSQRHDLGCVEDETDVVEGGGDEAAGRDGAFGILVYEGLFEEEGSEEGANGGDEETELGAFGGARAFVADWRG